jgi:hypothetical protein
MKSGFDEWCTNIGQNRNGDVLRFVLNIPPSQLMDKNYSNDLI